MATKLPLLLATMSYPTLFKAKVQGRPGQQTGDPKFSVNILIPKGDPQLVTIEAAIAAEILSGLNNVKPASDKNCLKDCALQYPDQTAIHGYMELRCNSSENNKPHTIDMDRQDIIDSSLVFGGAEAYFSVNISSYTTGSNGVGAYINGVMLTGKVGPLGRLDNKEAADTMFSQAPTTAGGVVPPTTPGAAPGTVAPQMTALANGGTYEAFIAAGWDDEKLIAGGYMLAPVAAPTPPPVAAPTPPPVAAPTPPPVAAAVHQMTALANGSTYEAFIAQGWDDEKLIAGGYMLPPGGQTTAF